MFNFFPQIIILLSLAGIIVIIARKIPALAEAAEKAKTQGFVSPKSVVREKAKVLGSKIKNFCIFVFHDIFKMINKVKKAVKEMGVGPHFVQKQLSYLVARKPSLIRSEKKISEIPVLMDPLSLLNKAADLVKNNNLDEAERIYIEVIKKDPKNIKAYQSLGEIYLKRHNFGDAKASFRQVIKLDPQNEEAQLQLKKLDEATEEAKEKIEEK